MEIIFENQTIKWINLLKPSIEELKHIAIEYNFQELTINDSLELGHLPKFESDEKISFLLVRFFNQEKKTNKNSIREFSNKISIYFGKEFIITVQQKENNIIENVIKNYLNKNSGIKITQNKILYYIISQCLKSFEEPANKMDEKIDILEKLIFNNNLDKLKLHSLYYLKREATACKKILTYNLDALNDYRARYLKSSSLQDLIENNTKMIHLHSQIVEDAQNLLSIYLSLNSQKSNDIMKTLTIFSAFFLPLTFIVGIYGMNFKFMPELNYEWSYPLCLLIMFLIVIVIFFWFKRKKYF